MRGDAHTHRPGQAHIFMVTLNLTIVSSMSTSPRELKQDRFPGLELISCAEF